MRYEGCQEALQISNSLQEFSEAINMPGLLIDGAIESLTYQIIESKRRVQFVRSIGDRKLAKERKEPSSALYDPLKASVVLASQGQHDEACWQVFLFAVFGKHLKRKWDLARAFYGALDGNMLWSWSLITEDIQFFSDWYSKNSEQFLQEKHRFGNHRKYESLRYDAQRSIPVVVASYVTLIQEYESHANFFEVVLSECDDNPRKAFELAYRRLDSVISFGRTTKFDYLCAIGNLGLANITPDKGYISESNGPLVGAKLLFGDDCHEIDDIVNNLADRLSVGPQELEDALCNWQKSPSVFLPFRG